LKNHVETSSGLCVILNEVKNLLRFFVAFGSSE